MKLQTTKISAVLVALLMVTAGGIATVAASAQQEQAEPSVSIDDQNTNGEQVRVSSVTPPENGGFIALHEGSEEGPVIGTSEYIAEQDRNVRIQLERQISSDTTVVAVLHEDTDGNQELNASIDRRYQTEDGDIVSDEADLTVRGGAAEDDDATADNETEEVENETEEELEEVENETEEIENETEEEPEEVENETEEPEEVENETEEEGAEDEDEVEAEEGFDVSNLQAVDTAPVNDTVTVTADVEAPDDREAGAVELRVEGDVVERRHVSFEDDDERTVEFNVNTTGLAPGTYVHGVFTEDDGEVAQITLTEQNASFNVSNLSAPADAPVGENVTVNATITNDGEANDTQNVTARLNGSVAAQENVTLDAGEETTVSLNVSADEEGTYYLGVLTRDFGEVQQLNVSEDVEENVTDNETAAPTANVSFENQTSNGSTVVVDSVNSSNGTFVAIHDATLLEGNVIGSVIGVSEYLEQGEHENVSVELYNVSGANFTESELTENQTLIAMPHLDTNENGTYDFVASEGAEDGPYVNETGAPVVDDGFVTIEAAEENVTDNETAAPTANVSFENQTSNGSTVVVDSVNSSNGTFVAIHDATLLEGNVIGSVIGVSEYLEQGEHENVSVELFNVSGADFAESELTENQTLIAMPHLDTNENGTYDFVATEGAEDGPYVNETGAPVLDDGFVTIEAAEENVTNVTENETNVTDNETNVTDNETNVTDGVTDNETNVTDNETNVTDGVTDNETNVTDNETNVTDNETNVTDNETNVTDNETNVTDNETNVTDNETAVNATASVEFNDQTTSGEIVGVASANLSEGGFVVIHDATLLDGEVLGSVIGVSEYLEPGEHDSVSVPLYDVPGLEANQTSLEEDQTLVAMPHFDTNDNETYDFLTTDGEEDGAYVMNGTPVIDDASVTVQSFDANDTTETTDSNETNESDGTVLT
ncbi:hypothetical protein G9464_05515 [Halostella sp. JP-L12]|uniref:DUF7282 domain-containing protein n=1 Tax=Halostella TaxID=1843185 RepID=UPI0013CE7776|nr:MULTISPECIES: hypothetical protein [Halostella]NHN47055.1 hypothetical protein [Halostella sp. JP-L12]